MSDEPGETVDSVASGGSPEGPGGSPPGPGDTESASNGPGEGRDAAVAADAQGKTGRFDFLTVLLILVVVLNVAFFLYNSYVGRQNPTPPPGPMGGPPPNPGEPPPGPGAAPSRPGSPAPVSGPGAPVPGPGGDAVPTPEPEPTRVALTPEQEFETIALAADNLDFQNYRFLIALIALSNQPEPVGLSALQRQRFLSEFSSRRLRRSLDSVTASLLGDVLTQEGLTPAAQGSAAGSPQARLEQTVEALTKAASGARHQQPREIGDSKLFQSVDQACVTILQSLAKGQGPRLRERGAAVALLYLYPVLATGTPTLTPQQKEWLKQHIGRKELDLTTHLQQINRATLDDASLPILQDHVRSVLYGSPPTGG